MKSLGQIAFEGSGVDYGAQWPVNDSTTKAWEAAAQAVRQAVLEEAAKVCEQDYLVNGSHMFVRYTVAELATQIRALKEKQ